MYNKYKNKKVIAADGSVFDSKKELRRWYELQAMQAEGKIHNLERQVKFTLIPTQREPSIVGKRGGLHLGKVIEKECYYLADYTYNLPTGEKVVEDAKGFKTKEYAIKRKLMLYVHGIRIKEI